MLNISTDHFQYITYADHPKTITVPSNCNRFMYTLINVTSCMRIYYINKKISNVCWLKGGCRRINYRVFSGENDNVAYILIHNNLHTIYYFKQNYFTNKKYHVIYPLKYISHTECIGNVDDLISLTCKSDYTVFTSNLYRQAIQIKSGNYFNNPQDINLQLRFYPSTTEPVCW